MKDEALKLALEALETELAVDMTNGAEVGEAAELMCEAITAIKQALALDKKAENARELGLDYEPDYKVTVVDDQHPNGVPLEQWGRPAPVQKSVAWVCYGFGGEGKHVIDYEQSEIDAIPVGTLLYTTPPAAQRQWVEVEQVKWDGEKFIAKLKEKNT